MVVKIISFTERGNQLNKRVSELFASENVESFGKGDGLIPLTHGLRGWAENAFLESDVIVFIGACGIAVRAAAPFIKTKDVDPAVVVLDEAGRFAIPILSGHLGGANRIAQMIADAIGAQPVITTATDVNGVFAADTWAKAHGCAVPHIEEIKHVSSALLRGDSVGLYSYFPVSGTLPDGLVPKDNLPVGISISLDDMRMFYGKTLHLVPICVHLGIGCRRDTAYEALEEFVLRTLKTHRISTASIKSISSIDLKKDEEAILRFCAKLDKTLKTYTAEVLNAVKGNFTASEFVKKTTGVDNICERSAVLSAAGGQIILKKTFENGVTIAAAMETWRAEF